MAKKQHYIPQCYLRAFSTSASRRTIGVFVLRTGHYFSSASIKDQAQQLYLYGKDQTIENVNGQLEGGVTPIIRAVIENNALPPMYSEDLHALLTFAVHLRSRTKLAGEALNESMDKLFKMAFKDHPVLKDHMSDFTIGSEYPSAYAAGIAMSILPLHYDLMIKLIVNRTRTPFITSDNPAVLCNPFLIHRAHSRSTAGVAISGVQIYLPLSPKHCLLMFDKDIYHVGEKSTRAVHVDQASDIIQINTLQGISADTCLYFDQSVDQATVSDIVRRSRGKRPQTRSDVEEYLGPDTPDGKKQSLIMLSAMEIRPNLKLSFVRETKFAQSIDLTDGHVPIRNKGLLNRVRGPRPPPPDLPPGTVFSRAPQST